MTAKPSIVDSINNIIHKIESQGLDLEMIVALIASKLGKKANKTQIRLTLQTLLVLEHQIEVNMAKRLPGVPP